MDKDDSKKRLEQLDIEKIMSSENGRRFLWKVLTYCGIYQDISFEEPYAAAKQAGKRQVGLYLLGILSEEQELNVFKMMQEARNLALEEETKYVNRDKEQQRNTQDGTDEPRTLDGHLEYPFGIPKGGDVFQGDSGELGTFI